MVTNPPCSLAPLTNSWAIYAGGRVRATDFTGTIGANTASTGAFTTLSSTGNTSFSGANCSISIQPTGTGVVYVNPATTGAMDNMIIGGTTPALITGTTITATQYVGISGGTF